MPNGGLDNCAVCGFNRGNEGVWAAPGHLSNERLQDGYCTLRDVKIPNPLWTYCLNCHTHTTVPEGPICTTGLREDGYLYVRVPWHGTVKPTRCETGTCVCGRPISLGIAIETDKGEVQFCCNGHYVKWWKEQHPGESYAWDLEEWPEPHS